MATSLGERLVSACTSFVVAVAGVFVAICWFIYEPWLVVLPLLATAAVEYSCDYYARHRLLPEDPRAAVSFIGWWILVPGAFAALIAGFLIVLSVWWEPSEKASIEEKKLLVALVTAVTTLCTTSFLKAAEESDTNWVAAHVKKVFQDRYRRHDPTIPHEQGICYFRAGSQGERWVYSDTYGGVSGWGGSARRTRASRVSDRLTTSDRVP